MCALNHGGNSEPVTDHLIGRRAASSAVHRVAGTLFSWCMFDGGGVRDERRVSRAQLLATLCLHIPDRGGASPSGAAALWPLHQGKPWRQQLCGQARYEVRVVLLPQFVLGVRPLWRRRRRRRRRRRIVVHTTSWMYCMSLVYPHRVGQTGDE